MSREPASEAPDCSFRRVLPDPRSVPTISVEGFARMVGVSRTSAYAAARRGDIPVLRIGHRILVPTVAVYRLLGQPLPTEEAE